MPKIDTICLRCSDPDAQRQFYGDALGMQERADGAIGYGAGEAGLVFEAADSPYRPSPSDLYWKIALAVPNIDVAHQQLTEKGIEIGAPHQFGDIAYLAHFKDPEGFTIELIDHWFQGHRPVQDVDTQRLGGGPCLNLLTLRAVDIDPVESSCNAFGMRPLSIAPVPNHGFTLYFYALTGERPPNPDLYAVENRTWVYQRPYTVLEIQHVYGRRPMTRSHAHEGGYGGVSISGMDRSFQDDHLRIGTTQKS